MADWEQLVAAVNEQRRHEGAQQVRHGSVAPLGLLAVVARTCHAWLGFCTARHGTARRGMVRHGMASHASCCKHGMAYRMAWHGMAWSRAAGMAWHAVALQAWHGLYF